MYLQAKKMLYGMVLQQKELHLASLSIPPSTSLLYSSCYKEEITRFSNWPLLKWPKRGISTTYKTAQLLLHNRDIIFCPSTLHCALHQRNCHKNTNKARQGAHQKTL